MMKIHFHCMLLTALVATTTVVADDDPAKQRQKDQQKQDRQQQQDQQQQDQQQQDQQQQDQQQQDQQQQDQQQQGQQQQGKSDSRQSSRMKVVPQGYVTIGADYNNDGRFDAIETIYLYDLKEAQEKSRQRSSNSKKSGDSRSGQNSKVSDKQRENQSDRYTARRSSMDSRSQRDQGTQRDQRSRRDRNSAKRSQDSRRSLGSQRGGAQRRDDRVRQLSGTISKTKTGKLAGKDGSYLIAHLDTEDGSSTCVVLGPEKKLSEWNLQKGDELKVRGVKARLNDRAVVMADKVMHDGNTVSVDLPPAQRLKRARGEITDLRTVRFRNFDQPFVVAEVKTPNQKRQVVNLGPKENLSKLDLSIGDEIRVLAREGRVNGESAMIAQQISAQDQMVNVPRPKDGKRFKSRNQSDDRG